jgi:hypothetical protein
MASGSWVFDPQTNELIPKSQYVRRLSASTEHARSGLPRPMIISDHLDGLFSHADGQIYTSKRAYYDSVKAHGCEIVGNEDLTKHTAPTYDAKAHEAEVVDDVRRAIAEVNSR